MTIAQQLKITTFPFEIKDAKGKIIYREWSDGWWVKREFDQDGNRIYHEDSDGRIIDNRPKPEPEPVKKQTAVEWFAEKVEQHLLTFGSIQPSVLSKFKQEAKAMEKERIEEAWKRGNLPTSLGRVLTEKDYYNETYGGDK